MSSPSVGAACLPH